jgi:hypothetical protein
MMETLELSTDTGLRKLDQRELSRGDREKFLSLINDLVDLKGKYTFKSNRYKGAHRAINELLDKTIAYAKTK